MRHKKYRWFVGGQYGGEFTNLKDAKKCAREASKTPEYNYKSTIRYLDDGCYYLDFENGKCVRDGWTR